MKEMMGSLQFWSAWEDYRLDSAFGRVHRDHFDRRLGRLGRQDSASSFD
jgi:predicted component of type VI protein secretion system